MATKDPALSPENYKKGSNSALTREEVRSSTMLGHSALFTLGLALFSSGVSALPVRGKELIKRADAYNSSLPLIRIFGTGGTIASSGSTGATTAGYSGEAGVNVLIDAVPELAGLANLDFVQVANIGSQDMNYTHLIPLHHNISETLANDSYKGAVVTHGTDTMEETSFFLDLTINSEKPVVIAGAMRPSTAISADGPMNLYQAVNVAGEDDSKGRGSLIVLNDRIGSGFWSTKQDANTLDTFRAVEQGYLGIVINGDVEFYYPPARPRGHQYFDISNVTEASEIPEVVILYSYQGLNPELIRHAVEDLGAKGIVLAGSGAGSWTSTGEIVNREMVAQYNVPIVDSRRTMDGSVPVADAPDYTVASGFLNPQKSRILLQLCLHAGYSLDQIRTSFSSVYGG